jgi:hypothetical protein
MHSLVLLAVLPGCLLTEVTEPDPTAIDKDRKRGCVSVRELGWAGSMDNAGNFDPDDDFIEFDNSDCNKPVDLSGWMLHLRGDMELIYIVPDDDSGANIVLPGELKVLIAKRSGAFRANAETGYAPIHVPGMYFPERNFAIETRTAEDFLIENEFNNKYGEPLAGGFDGYTVRSMERTDDNFDEEGTSVTSWHSYTPCNESPPATSDYLYGTGCKENGDVNLQIGQTGSNVHADYAERTYASPGERNTPQYK